MDEELRFFRRSNRKVAKMSKNENLETMSLIGDGLDEFEDNVRGILKEWEESLPPLKKMENPLKIRHTRETAEDDLPETETVKKGEPL